MTDAQRLRSVDLFADLSDDDLDTLLKAATPVELEQGECLFTEGDSGEEAFVITDGDLEIVKRSQHQDVLLAVRGPGDVIGEMALLEAAPRMATARARTPVRMLSIPKSAFEHLVATSPSAARALFGVLLRRWRETESRLRHSERMAQLGTLTAGVAHELNNPMAAVQRAAGSLADAVDEYARTVSESARDLPEEALQLAARVASDQERPRLDAIARSDAESSLEDTLTDLGVSEPWAAASALVEAGITADDLQGLGLNGQALETTSRLLTTTVGLRSLIHQIIEGSRRVSEIVRVLKGYSHLDEAPIQEVVITDGIDDTLLLLSGAIGDIEVIREYGEVPEITAYPDELNQVWTNLIDNAVDAITDGGGGRIVVRAFTEDDTVVVEVADDGPGIPEDALPRVFDPFFTTKEPGQGTGLGLDISYGIVAQRHGGEITVKETGPEGTTFRVVLPIKGAAAER